MVPRLPRFLLSKFAHDWAIASYLLITLPLDWAIVWATSWLLYHLTELLWATSWLLYALTELLWATSWLLYHWTELLWATSWLLYHLTELSNCSYLRKFLTKLPLIMVWRGVLLRLALYIFGGDMIWSQTSQSLLWEREKCCLASILV